MPIASARAFFLPGVPEEMQNLFSSEVVPRLGALAEGGPVQLVLQTFGLRESTANDMLAGLESEFDVKLGYRAHFPTIEVKILATDVSHEKAQQRCELARDEVLRRLGDNVVFAQNREQLAKVVGDLCLSHKLTLCTAESCTGGLVGELITRVPGSSRYFLGSIVAYDNTVKTQLLSVEDEVLMREGAVSEAVAKSMAEGARAALKADAAIGITGAAGPGGGTDDKPVGLVHYAVALPDRTVSRKLMFPSGREKVRRLAAFASLALLRELLLEKRGA